MQTFDISKSFTQEHADKLKSLKDGSISWGPLDLTWSLDLSVPQITADASLFSAPIADIVINTSNPSATVGGSVGIAEAELTLTADFSGKKITYKVFVKALGHEVANESGIVFSW